MPTKQKTHSLHPVVAKELEARLEMIAQKERELSMLRDGLHWFLYQQTGIDVAREDWTLDKDHWQLHKKETV